MKWQNKFYNQNFDEFDNITPELKQSIEALIKNWDMWKGLSLTSPLRKKDIKRELIDYLNTMLS